MNYAQTTCQALFIFLLSSISSIQSSCADEAAAIPVINSAHVELVDRIQQANPNYEIRVP